MLKHVPCWLVMLALPLACAAAGKQCHILRSPPIPVTVLDGRPIISARINGMDARFLVDTGSFFQLLFPSAVAQFKLQVKWHPGFYTAGVGGYDNPDSTTVDHFAFGSIQVPNVLFLVSSNDLSQPGIAGLLGENLFRLWDEELDFANGVLRLVQPQHCNGEILAYWAGNQPVSVVDLQSTDKAETDLIGTASVNGHEIRVLFDTGAGRSMLSLEAARQIGLSPGSPGVVAAGIAEGLGQQQLVDTWAAPVAEFEIGSEKIEHTRVAIGDLDTRYENPNEHYDMLLGADFFLAHHVYIANSQSKLYFTYSGGPVFAISPLKAATAKRTPSGAAPSQPVTSGTAAEAASAAASDASASPSDLMRRGLAAESRGLLDVALADFTRACNLDSHDSDCPYQRGLLRWRLHQQDLALQDFDTAVRISPNDYQALLARAELQVPRLRAAVRPDVDAVDRLAPQADNVRLTLGGLYNDIHQYPEAVREVTIWIGYHPEDVQLRFALNDRCWFRAEANQDLPAALKDCNRALHLAGAAPATLDSRGLVYLRLGKPDEAIADYDAALQKNPKMPTSLFGRGLAELTRGEKTRGQADIAAAEALDPKVGEFFSSIGLEP